MIQSSGTMAEFPSALTMASFLGAGTNAKIRPKAPISTAVPMIAARSADLDEFHDVVPP